MNFGKRNEQRSIAHGFIFISRASSCYFQNNSLIINHVDSVTMTTINFCLLSINDTIPTAALMTSSQIEHPFTLPVRSGHQWLVWLPWMHRAKKDCGQRWPSSILIYHWRPNWSFISTIGHIVSIEYLPVQSFASVLDIANPLEQEHLIFLWRMLHLWAHPCTAALQGRGPEKTTLVTKPNITDQMAKWIERLPLTR